MSTPARPIPRLDLVGIVVRDMKASLAFYRLLGLDLPAEADTEGHVEVRVGDLRLAWDTEDVIRSFDPQWRAPTGGARMSLAFALPTPTDVDATYRHVTAHGAFGHLEPFDAPWGMRYAVLHDPDGNAVDLFAPLA
ncbi:VOC family protein [Deinococcus pimensis]|uniref:VOC family protein n=1 Tax=Deinococcus pimensis TaxID=309888 RepID=UPI00048938FD|nr:VOC family protein [Deinococcus pimensis]